MSNHESETQRHVTLDVTSTSVEETIAFGKRLGACLRPGDLVVLSGELGAGKTHLAKGIIAGLGSTDLVNSPSYVLINQYRAGPQHRRAKIYHADLYRLEDTADLATIGLTDVWEGDEFCVIEWPERAADALPAERLQVELVEHVPDQRRIRLTAHGARYRQRLAAIRMHAGEPDTNEWLATEHSTE
ncbi:MAG TPA: tRNA (adenosine(37)-N6)-threonylcarbamoyltransferase complex ATPase subunit type 1 TsaE [Roseiflexaceae bacterium]|nr:tRNA (adenosine(37)-N6)-threonylcarbamoyltransferase complex ATPase subunit type 1 TsaE [Roseiflexaceae bacterium]